MTVYAKKKEGLNTSFLLKHQSTALLLKNSGMCCCPIFVQEKKVCRKISNATLGPCVTLRFINYLLVQPFLFNRLDCHVRVVACQ